jgi:hypothetical protein
MPGLTLDKMQTVCALFDCHRPKDLLQPFAFGHIPENLDPWASAERHKLVTVLLRAMTGELEVLVQNYFIWPIFLDVF